MMDKKECLDLLRNLFKTSPFVQLCGIRIDEVTCGSARLSMEMEKKKSNISGYMHGGALSTFIDNAAGTACRTIGAEVVTLSATVNYVRGVKAERKIKAESRIVEKTHRHVFVEVDVRNEQNEVLAKGLLVMYCVGKDDRVPDEW